MSDKKIKVREYERKVPAKKTKQKANVPTVEPINQPHQGVTIIGGGNPSTKQQGVQIVKRTR